MFKKMKVAYNQWKQEQDYKERFPNIEKIEVSQEMIDIYKDLYNNQMRKEMNNKGNLAKKYSGMSGEID